MHVTDHVAVGKGETFKYEVIEENEVGQKRNSQLTLYIIYKFMHPYFKDFRYTGCKLNDILL